MRKVTFILKNLTDETYNLISNMETMARFEKLTKWAFGDLKHCVSVKYGSGQFRDRVDLNHHIKNGGEFKEYKIENRKGYKLATFIY